MHRRNSANPRRLDRRKSTTSVKSVHLKHIPPETAERDAQVAATKAFARANARSTTESELPLWPPPRCGGDLGGTAIGYSPYHPKTRSDETPFRRQQSIRFVQPRVPNLRPNSSMTQRTSPSCTPHTSNHAADIDVDLRPSSNTSASGMVSAAKGAAGDYISTLFTSEEYYTPEDDIASMPSSYRKLRKSRSMFTNRPPMTAPEHPSLSQSSASANQLPLPANSRFHPHRGNENMPPRGLKAHKSMGFLRDIRGSFMPASKYENDALPFTSTDGHIGNQDRSQNTLRPKPANLFAKDSRQDRVFRKSMRSTPNETVSIDDKPGRDGSLRHKARRVSQGFKHKLKNLFGLAKGDKDDTALPLQHIDAQKSHIFGMRDLQHDTGDELYRVSSADQAALSHVTSGIPSLHAVPSYQQVRSRQGSMESLRSEQRASDDKSRVTSWSDSDTNTVITHNSCQEERERKRLSIINEHGAHVCSSSARFMTISEQSNPSSTSLHRPVQAAPVTADGRRIYSALMKRVEQLHQAHSNSAETSSGEEDTVNLGTVPRRRSALRLRRPGYDPASTIRYVMPESESDSEFPEEQDGLQMKDSQGSPSAYSSKSSLPAHNQRREGGQAHSASASRLIDVENDVAPVSATREAPPLVRTLSSRSSAFFGSPTRHLFRTQSPYRRVLQDKMHTAPDEQAIRSPDFNPWMRSLSNLPNLPMRRSSTHGSDADIKLQYTESIYSEHTEDGQTKRHSFLSVVEDFPRPTSTHGDVAIFVNPPEYNRRSSSLPPKQRVSSSSSSVEWKMWLSSNVSKLEETTTQVDSKDFQNGLTSARSSRHVREKAQINEEEEDQVCDPTDTPSRGRANMGSFLNLNHDDEDENDTEQPTPFDAGEKNPAVEHSPFADPSSANVSASSVASSLKYSREAAANASTGDLGINREKELPRVPSLEAKENRSNEHSSIATRLVKRLPKPKNVLTPLTSRVLSSAGEDQPTKVNISGNTLPKMYSMASKKLENVSPTAIDGSDPYGIEGSGILGPTQQNVGSRRMVDIFLSSRRRRMASGDEGSVFL
ncbi:hypothetical protein NUW58_g2740 [Xylaria curta]|uniref:Uncharacterized protein n=1 Tax=Xylaria curta TaxID=42375 RepID=A0ACC1PGI5_9PEZI|nr:hypothetical protein NUW58_g2740 [Xylaria curta]